MKTHLACLLAAFVTLVAPDLAHACGTGAALFADDFKTPDAGWVHNADGKIGSGAITLLPPVKNRPLHITTAISSAMRMFASISSPTTSQSRRN